MPAPFVHLHLHSQYSLLDGAIKLDQLFERAQALGMPAVALTDHGNLFGAIEFYEKAREKGVKPILGCEVYVAAGSRFDKEAARARGERLRRDQPPAAARDERDRLPEPDPAGLEGLSRGLLLQAADRPRAAAPATPRG